MGVGGLIVRGGQWLYRTLAGAKPLVKEAEKVFLKSGATGLKQKAQIVGDIAGRTVKQVGGRLATAGAGLYTAGELIDYIGGGGATGQWGAPAPSPITGGSTAMPTQYPVAPAGFQGPMQPMVRGFRYPMQQPIRGYVRWVDPFGTVYWRRKPRRMNVLNPRALRRAHTRVQGFEKFVMRNFTIARRSKVKRKKRRR